MTESDDLYEILEVHPLAELEIINGAFRRLAAIYREAYGLNPDPQVAKKMTRITNAYNILSDPEKRKKYDTERNAKEKPKKEDSKELPFLKILPKHIVFKDMGYLDTKTTYIDVDNIGGRYDKLVIVDDYLPKWLQITDIERLSEKELPIRINIKAIGQTSVTESECYIPITIERRDINHIQEIKVHIEIIMKDHGSRIHKSSTLESQLNHTKNNPIGLRKCNKCGMKSLWYNHFEKKYECLNRQCGDYSRLKSHP